MHAIDVDHQLMDWLTESGRGDGAAFRRLYEATSPKLFGFAVRILVNRELAEEVLQESYVSIWHNAAGYQPGLAAPMTWLTAIVRNKALDALRRSADETELTVRDVDPAFLEATPGEGPSPLEALAHSGDAAALARCLQQLDAPHRQALALAFYHDLSHSELAQQFRLPIGTVKSWIRRSLERLRRCMGQPEGA